MATTSEAASNPRSELNAWLVEEMYDQFRDDPSSLSQSWQDFFQDYRPEDAGPSEGGDGAAEHTNGGAQPSADGDSAPPAADRTEEDAAQGEDDGAAQTEARADGQAKASNGGARRADGDDRRAAVTAAVADAEGADTQRIRGVKATIVSNMERSLGVPTATSVRDVPAKLLEVNRRILNNYLRRSRGGKVSFTHLIAYAMVRAVEAVPAITSVYTTTEDGKPAVIRPDHFGLGLAVDVERKGGRVLLVPVIQEADTLGFGEFLRAYEDLIRRVRTNKLDMAMFEGATLTVTNPGTIGTVHSVPRLMAGQAAILGVGAIDYPAQYQAADPKALASMGVSKVISLTSTYDHRVIQGAESGLYLKRIHELLLGEHNFYDEVFRSLALPYEPARWAQDSSPVDSETALLHKQMQVDELVRLYRVRGHLIADLDPLRQRDPVMHPELDPNYYGLTIWDLDREFLTESPDGVQRRRLDEILGVLRDAYCRTIGVEYLHIQHPDHKAWIRERVEGADIDLSEDEQQWVLQRLNAAEAFESFLHTKYVGQKRFGLEGAESLIPLLDTICELAADAGISDVVMGMAHRGRLNVLSNVIGKSHREIFREFEGDIDPDTVQGSGDVKYHLGTEGTYHARSGAEVALRMPPNPSHLEAVNPIVEGIVRALQDLYDGGDEGVFPVLPLLMHGDAAFAGQGVVAETLNLSQLRGYRTGGTVHVVINNQVGFTTAPESARSSVYPTDVAKTVQAPIFHVNGDDPEAVVRVARLAFAYRQEFQTDVVIDLVCYRRHGHNEADDPSFTQPRMYELIDNRRSIRKLYTEQLVRRGDISIERAEEFLDDFHDRLQAAFDETKQSKPPEPPQALKPEEPDVRPRIETGVAEDVLDRAARAQFTVPDGFTRHPKLDRIFKKAQERYEQGDIDWALGETLAFGSILLDGTTVRLAGQDSRRGTFSQRHAVLVDYRTGEEHLPLAHLADDQGSWFIYDSLLSEYAAVGFDYGYSVADQQALVCWEAQFGDFVNGAQVVLDQFVVAAEDKWDETSGLVLLLPHGYEGQGPEHSSARIERFLTLCAEDNIQVVQPTTAAQYFHVLRRQVARDVRKPLIVFTPKSLLRSPNAFSAKADLTSGCFRETLDDPRLELDADDVRTLVLCHGKIAYDVMTERAERGAPLAVVRVEQLYPWPDEQIRELLERYANATDIAWTQDEPRNMGGWSFVQARLEELLADVGGDRRLRVVSRAASASPAAGQHIVHEQELEQLLDEVFAELDA